MFWEYAIVGVIMLAAIAFAGRSLYRTLTGREKPCDSCPTPDSCHLGETPEEIAERLRAALSRKEESK